MTIDSPRSRSPTSQSATLVERRVRSDFLNVLQERGFLQQCTDLAALDDALLAGTVTGYVGYDMTARSLHIGNLITLMMLRWFQRTGRGIFWPKAAAT